MDVQKITTKLFTDAPPNPSLDPFLAIFARWGQEKNHPAGWVDMADYAHVRKGPGVMLVGHRGNLALDLADPGPGILYSNKRDLEGTIEDRILEAFSRCTELARELIVQPEYPAAFKPSAGFWELTFNDRLDLPNTETTDRLLRPAVDRALDELLGAGSYMIIRQSDPTRRYGFIIHCSAVDCLEGLSAKLQYAAG